MRRVSKFVRNEMSVVENIKVRWPKEHDSSHLFTYSMATFGWIINEGNFISITKLSNELFFVVRFIETIYR